MTSIHDQAIRIIGARPPGDPIEMRRHSGELANIATELEEQARAITAANVHGQAPYVSRTNFHARQRSEALVATAGEVREWAGTLESQAAAVEGLQGGWDTRYERQTEILQQTATAGGARR